MPNLLNSCDSLLLLLLLSSLFYCNVSAHRTEETITLDDGFEVNFDLSKDRPKVEIRTPIKWASIFVSVDNARLWNGNCQEKIKIISRALESPLILCDSKMQSRPSEVDGSLTITYIDAGFSPKKVKVKAFRFFKPNQKGICSNKTDLLCGWRCIWKGVECDGQLKCFDGNDYTTCSATDKRRCDLPGAAIDGPPESSVKKAWSVAAYTTGIIICTIFGSAIIGSCFLKSCPDDEEEQETRERRLDPLLDHPPSYEDVMNMDLSATIHRHAVPKRQTSDSP